MRLDSRVPRRCARNDYHKLDNRKWTQRAEDVLTHALDVMVQWREGNAFVATLSNLLFHSRALHSWQRSPKGHELMMGDLFEGYIHLTQMSESEELIK